MNDKAVVLLSGGLDSCVALAKAITMHDEVKTISFNYGQRHSRELLAAMQIAEHYQVPYMIVDISVASKNDDLSLFRGSSQTDPRVDVPEGHYEAETMKITVVPNRNMVMLSIAAAWAVSTGAKVVYFGAHAGDHAIYKDCRPEFVTAMNNALRAANPEPIEVRGWLGLTKAQIVKDGEILNAPLHLTYSCYKGYVRHCGKCGTCVERREAFELAEVEDPTDWMTE